jgi:hypothetical protein
MVKLGGLPQLECFLYFSRRWRDRNFEMCIARTEKGQIANLSFALASSRSMRRTTCQYAIILLRILWGLQVKLAIFTSSHPLRDL